MTVKIELYDEGLNLLRWSSSTFQRDYTLAKSMPPKRQKRWDERTLIFPAVEESATFIHLNWPDALWCEGTSHYLQLALDREKEREELRERKHGGVLEDNGTFEYARPPRAHQRNCFLLSRDLREFGIFHEQGCGKTNIIYNTAFYLLLKDEISLLLIIAPNGVHSEWIERELANEIPPNIDVAAHYVSTKWTQKETQAIQDVLDAETGLRILSFATESLASKKAQKRLDDIIKVHGKDALLALDESSDIKTPKAKRTMFINRIGSGCAYRRIADGTPITEGAHEYFAQMRFLSPSILGQTTHANFQARYVIKGGWNGGQVKGYQNLDELMGLIDPYTDRVLKQDVVADLPPKTYKRMPFEFTSTQQSMINDLRDKAFIEYKGHTLDPQLAITRLIRIQQIASGWFPTEEFDGRLIPLEGPNPRFGALQSIIRHAHDQIIVWSRFTSDLISLQAQLGSRAVSYHGKIKPEQRKQNVAAWRKAESIDIMLAQPASGLARGHTLNESATTVYYANGHSLRQRLQSEDRNHRDGQHRAVIVWDLEGLGCWSPDTRIIGCLKNKKDIVNEITGDPGGFLELG